MAIAVELSVPLMVDWPYAPRANKTTRKAIGNIDKS
jgi:hypothetical protein